METKGKITMDGEVVERDESKIKLVTIHDRTGNMLKMQPVGNGLYSTFFDLKAINGVKTYNLRADDVYLAGYARTGTNWTYERMSMLLRGKAETIKWNKTKAHVEVSLSQDLEEQRSPRIICAHMPLSHVPDQLAEKKCKVIYTLRDPKDVAVSLYHLYRDLPYIDYQGKFEDFLYLFMDGNVDFRGLFANIKAAEQYFADHPNIPVFIHVYEDAVRDPVRSTQELSDFLQLPRDDTLCQSIAQKCVLKKLKVDKKDYTFKVDDRSVLFRKGISGDWRNYFTEEMMEDYYRVYEEKMAGSRFYHLYSRDKDF